MADLNALFGLPAKAEPETNAPAVSLAWALVFQELGGLLGIDYEGHRYTSLPDPTSSARGGRSFRAFPILSHTSAS